jgi:EAL domain-containing protein (putative c-di-GMP-specific phosphodiesterase class I)/DNA-binding NarL/FixJ family response regulator
MIGRRSRRGRRAIALAGPPAGSLLHGAPCHTVAPVTDGPIRVMIADDEAVLRDTLAELVASDAALELVGSARDADEAIAVAQATRPDVALVDVRMPGGGGIRVAEVVHSSLPRTRVLALTVAADRTTVVRMLESGAVGYLVKGTSPTEIVGSIVRAARGQPSISPDVMSGLVKGLAEQLEREEIESSERLARTALITAAMEDDGRSIVYQPIVELEDHRVVGMEALSRFPDTGSGWTVDRWFAVATEVGLGAELELACARTALADLGSIPRDRFVSVNLSHRAAESDAWIELLDGVDADRVVVEITEHEAVEDYDRLMAALGRVRDRGTRVAIDDAGAGFASLRHILRIEPDIIKLDVSLTRDVHAHPPQRALAAALVSFADELGMSVIAEGVERQEEQDTLIELGVRLGQGYFMGRPAPLQESN